MALIVQADARALPIPSGYVQTVVTSPPYWGLRDYGVAGQIGLEPTPQEYVQNLVTVFREVRRVLRDDGTVWLNLGDSYASQGGHTGQGSTSQRAGRANVPEQNRGSYSSVIGGLKAKDLVGIPWRVAFALQADGWYLRSDIIWAKPNPMPESVTDRPTRSHEYLFLLTKRERYYYDHEAIKEQANQTGKGNARSFRGGGAYTKGQAFDNDAVIPRETVGNTLDVSGSRNRRTVWAITPKPYKGAHFATFPPELVEPCILAGTPEGGCCGTCGAPFKRQIEKGQPRLGQQIACGGDATGTYGGVAQKDYLAVGAQDASATKARILAGMVERRTVGWAAQCKCGDVSQPAVSVVLDPFAGSGTTGQVAERLGRFAILCELSAAYLPLIQQRLG